MRHDPYQAFRFRNFRLLFLASTLSVVGGLLEGTALGWELYARTRDPFVLGNIGLAGFLPVVLLALPAGHAADRFDRKRIVVISRLFEVVGALGLAYLSWTQGALWLIYGCVFLASAARAFGGPAAAAFLPHSVPAAVFSNATTWLTASFQVAGMIAPAIGGFAIAWLPKIIVVEGPVNVGATLAYGFAALLSVIIAIAYSRLTIATRERSADAVNWRGVVAGVRFVFRERLVLSAITLDLFAVLFGGAVALLPVFASDVLHVGAEGFGWLRAAPAVGATLMALVLTRRPPMQQAGKTLLWVVAGFGVATIIFGLSRNFWLSLGALALVGAFDNVSMVIRGVLVPLRTPDSMRGRVSAVERVFISSSNELGAWESGVTAAAFGPIGAVVGGGIGTLIVVGFVMIVFPQLRHVGTLHDLPPATDQSGTV